MIEGIAASDLSARIDKLTEEAAEIRRRYATSSSSEQSQLEARYSELEQELKAIKNKLSKPSFSRSSSVGLVAGTEGSGPFGISMGMRVENLGSEPELIGRGKYRLSSVPKPHSAFERYIVQASPKCGICWVKAVGKDISTSRYGTELRIAFDEMQTRLEKVYGPGYDRTDMLMPDSIWSEMGDWMMALIKGERHLSAMWGNETDAVLPHQLQHIFLYASALDDESGYIAVEYSFVNAKESEEELAAEEDDAL